MAKEETSDLSREMEALRADLGKLRADFAGVAEALKDAGHKRADGVREGLADLLHSVREELQSALDHGKDTGKKSVEAVGHQIGQRPLASLLTAFGVGFVLAKLLDREKA
ncbi:MAG: hypothetical protein SCH98_14010 [Deferrisomatales bacterium]|nr:hypothetical protein [Deferrisomatales bacterium]